MRNARIIFLAVLLSVVAGCATKGGWPCWAWDKSTDQKNAKAEKLWLADTNHL
jgi:hypothetical protein